MCLRQHLLAVCAPQCKILISFIDWLHFFFFFWQLHLYILPKNSTSSSEKLGNFFRVYTETPALSRNHLCFGLFVVARWHIKSGMCCKGHVLAMRQKEGVSGLQMTEKTRGKNWLHTDSNVQHNRAVKESECVQECLSVVNMDFVALEETKPIPQNVHW